MKSSYDDKYVSFFTLAQNLFLLHQINTAIPLEGVQL